MPQVTITRPFNYQRGVEVERYKPGKQEVRADVASHALANGFLEQAVAESARQAPVKPTTVEEAQGETSHKKAT